MIIARVSGTVTAPQKNPHLEGKKLLVVEPLDLDGKRQGAAMIAVDAAQAGTGDIVLINKEGGGARLVFGDEKIPVQAVVVGVIDGIDLDGKGPVSLETWR